MPTRTEYKLPNLCKSDRLFARHTSHGAALTEWKNNILITSQVSLLCDFSLFSSMTPEGVKSLASAKLIWMRIGRDSDTFWTAEVLVLHVVRAAEWVSSTKQLFASKSPTPSQFSRGVGQGLVGMFSFMGFLVISCYYVA